MGITGAAGEFGDRGSGPDPALFVANILLGSVLYTWIYDNAARSVLAMVVVHFTENFVGQVTSIPPAAEPVGLAVRALVVLVVVALFGAGSFRRDGTVPSPPPALAGPDGGRQGTGPTDPGSRPEE